MVILHEGLNCIYFIPLYWLIFYRSLVLAIWMGRDYCRLLVGLKSFWFIWNQVNVSHKEVTQAEEMSKYIISMLEEKGRNLVAAWGYHIQSFIRALQKSLRPPWSSVPGLDSPWFTAVCTHYVFFLTCAAWMWSNVLPSSRKPEQCRLPFNL